MLNIMSSTGDAVSIILQVWFQNANGRHPLVLDKVVPVRLLPTSGRADQSASAIAALNHTSYKRLRFKVRVIDAGSSCDIIHIIHIIHIIQYFAEGMTISTYLYSLSSPRL